MRKSPEARFILVEEGDDIVLHVEIKEGRKWLRIAKRYSGQHWISLEPGYTVRGSEPGCNYGSIEIEYAPVNAMPQ